MSSDLDRALSDLSLIKGHLTAGAAFQGYGPAAIAVTGFLAGATWAFQAFLGVNAATPQMTALTPWFVVAVASLAVVGVEMIARGRRHHEGLADAMIFEAAERFLPAGGAGALLALVMLSLMPDLAWLLPSLWSILVGLGILSAARSIPGRASLAGGWYVLAGAGVMVVGSESRVLEPWMMGLPFCVGQFLLALLVRLAPGARHAD